MRSQSPYRDSKSQARSKSQRSLETMATPRRPQPPKKSGFLGVVFLFGIMGGVVWLAMLVFGWGPYASEVISPTPSLTAISIFSSGSTVTPSQTNTQTTAVTQTLAPTFTPTLTPSPTMELMPFILIGEAEYLSSALIRPSLGCEWLVIAGQVWDLQDAPVRELSLHLFGELDGFEIDRFALTGSASNYGESGYEFTLENVLVDSQDSLFVQLVDSNGIPFSHPYELQTFNDCQKNLVLVNFKQVR